MYSKGVRALEGLQPPPIIIGVDKVVEVRFELPMAVIVIAFDGCFLDCAVHPFDLPVGPGMLDPRLREDKPW
jgi:hypothetical protein